MANRSVGRPSSLLQEDFIEAIKNWRGAKPGRTYVGLADEVGIKPDTFSKILARTRGLEHEANRRRLAEIVGYHKEARKHAFDTGEDINSLDHSVIGLVNYGYTLEMRGRGIEAVSYAQAALSERNFISKYAMALVYNQAAWIYYRERRFSESLRNAEASLNLCAHIGYDSGRADALCIQGLIAIEPPDPHYPLALERLSESLQIYKKISDSERISALLWNVGHLQQRWGNLPAAHRFYKNSAEVEGHFGLQAEDAYTFDWYAALAVQTGDHKLAAQLNGRAKELRIEYGVKSPCWERDLHEEFLKPAEEDLGSMKFRKYENDWINVPLQEILDQVISFFDKTLDTRKELLSGSLRSLLEE